MSFIELPDRFPGRCLNYRNQLRCLDYDRHDSACQFPVIPKPDWDTNEWNMLTSTTPTPVPWKSPLENHDK